MPHASVWINRGQQGDAGNEARQLVDPEVLHVGNGLGRCRRRRTHDSCSRWVHRDSARHLLIGVAPAVAHVRGRVTFGREKPKLVPAERIRLPPCAYLKSSNGDESALRRVTGP